VPSTLVSALNSGPSSLSASHGWGHGVVFLGKTHYSHIASLHVGVLVIGTDKFNAGCYPVMDSASHSGGSRNTPNRLMLQKCTNLMGYLA